MCGLWTSKPRRASYLWFSSYIPLCDNNFTPYILLQTSKTCIQINPRVAIQFEAQDISSSVALSPSHIRAAVAEEYLGGAQSSTNQPTNSLTSDDGLLSHRSSTTYDINACPERRQDSPLTPPLIFPQIQILLLLQHNVVENHKECVSIPISLSFVASSLPIWWHLLACVRG